MSQLILSKQRSFILVQLVIMDGLMRMMKVSSMLKKRLGDDVIMTTIENVAENSDSERVITSLARKNDIVFTTSFGYMNPTIKVAKRYPDVKFEHATGYMLEDNVSVYSARFYEGRHVIGKIAGRMTESNVIGYIASFPNSRSNSWN